ncbi:MAG: hypothetical protein OXE94_08530 [Aestuariivita sp.]|nr:hypothetical protein [Aestuariivita sp.]MCY4203423.1 hypothetical protein [Aestuariivita sp.]MCY4287250.1 hypothetical protein [Aestuariivita sp.]MCY4347475.1 hypothetical protein [Aestuariivita sp.]
MSEINVAQIGIGGVGSGIVREILKTSDLNLVGVVAFRPEKIGQDVGTLLGLSKPANVATSSSIEDILTKHRVDVILLATSKGKLHDCEEEITPLLKRGINVISPCMDVSDPHLYDAAATRRIEAACLKGGSAFVGIGSTQLVLRSLFALCETARDIKTVRSFVHADVTKFPLESKRHEFGILMTANDFKSASENNELRGRGALIKEAEYIAIRLGLDFDQSTSRYDPIIEEDTVIGVDHIFEVFKDEVCVVSYTYRFIEDRQHQYFHRFEVDSTPSINARVDFSLDRGIEGTIVPMVKAIKPVFSAPPGIVTLHDLPTGIVPYTLKTV